MNDRRQVNMTPEAVTARLRRVAELTRFCRALKARPKDPVQELPVKDEGLISGKSLGPDSGSQ